MDKEWFISFMNNHMYKGTVSNLDALKIIKEYCLELSKEPEHVDSFLNALSKSHLIYNYLVTATSYYKRKFELIEIRIIDTNNIAGYLPIAVY